MSWHAKQTYGYLRSSQEAEDNAKMVLDTLSPLGWGKAAVCAALGNFEVESGYNPWRWQSETVLPVGDSRIGIVCGGNTAHAYGIFQSDPAANYIYRGSGNPGYAPNYSDQTGDPNDGTAQMHYLNWVCENYSDGSCGGWNESYLDAIPFATFKAQTDLTNYTIAQLTKIFHDGYERSARWQSTNLTRIDAANHWWNYFQGYTPPSPTGQAIWIAAFRVIAKRKEQQTIYYKKKRGGFR